jgi:hypothetical protein
VASGQAEFDGLGEGLVCRFEVAGRLVGQRQTEGGEWARVQVVLGQERESPLGVLDCVLRISPELPGGERARIGQPPRLPGHAAGRPYPHPVVTPHLDLSWC